jgi:hypothetical protein
VPGLVAGVEGLDDNHAAAAARARGSERGLRRIIGGRLIFSIGAACDFCDLQEFASPREARIASAAGEQAVVADAVEALTWLALPQGPIAIAAVN